MKNFPDKLITEDLTHETGKLRSRVERPFRYFVGGEASGVVLTVPAGEVVNFASTPRPLWFIVPPFGRYSRAAVVHDFLYRSKNFSRAIADAVFLEAMADLGVKGWKRWAMYLAVRLFGWLPYRRAMIRG